MTSSNVKQAAIIASAAFMLGAVIDHSFISNRIETPSKPVATEASRAAVPASLTGDGSRELTASSQKLWSSSENVRANSKKSLDAILGEHDPKQRMSDLEAFISNLQPGDFADALKRIRRLPGSNDRELASRLLVARWVQSDPDSALQFAASNRGFEYVADDVFQQAAANDLQSALDRARALPNGDLRYMALRGVLSFMADSNPAGALQLAQTLGQFPGNEPLNSVIYRQWAATDPQAAALEAAQDSSGAGWRSPMSQVVRTWAGQDPAAAANWSLSLSDPEAQSRSISQVMRQWAREDVTSAANFINGLPPGGTHDSAVAALAYSIAPNDPQNAVNWADNIADETARNNALQRLSREVMWRDPTNGAAVLQAAGVPANLIPPPGRGDGGPPPAFPGP